MKSFVGLLKNCLHPQEEEREEEEYWDYYPWFAAREHEER